MKKKTMGLLGVFAISGSVLAGCGGAASNNGNTGDAKDEVIVTMPTTSEPESGFDPAYGWGWRAHTPMELYNIYHSLDTSPVKMAEYSPYKNETVNKYMDEALAAEDLEESYDLWKKAQWDGAFNPYVGMKMMPWAIYYSLNTRIMLL